MYESINIGAAHALANYAETNKSQQLYQIKPPIRLPNVPTYTK